MRTFGVGAVFVTMFVPDGRNGTLQCYIVINFLIVIQEIKMLYRESFKQILYEMLSIIRYLNVHSVYSTKVVSSYIL
jgi:hypothetical protein